MEAAILGMGSLKYLTWLYRESTIKFQPLFAHSLNVCFDRYKSRITSQHKALCKWFLDSLEVWVEDSAKQQPQTLSHDDYRLDNLLFTPTRCVAVDFQTINIGNLWRDARCVEFTAVLVFSCLFHLVTSKALYSDVKFVTAL